MKWSCVQVVVVCVAVLISAKLVSSQDGNIYGFNEEVYVVREGDGNVVLEMDVQQGNLQGGINNEYLMVGVTTIPEMSDDFEMPMPAMFLVNVSMPMGVITVPIVDDIMPEGNENFTVVAELISSNINITISPDTALVVIQDNDVVIGFERTEYTVSESDTDITITVALSSGTLRDGEPVILNVMTSSDDLGSPQPLIVTISSAAPSAMVTIPIVDDSISEMSPEALVISLMMASSPPPGVTVLVSPMYASVLILDNDAVTVGFTMATASVSEGNTVTVCVELTMGELGRDLTLNITSSTSSTATADDYSLEPMTITFLSGSVVGTSVCTNVTAVADGVLEEDMESLMLTLSTTEERVTINPDTISVSITDVDTVNVSLAEYPSVNVLEASGSAMVTVVFSSAAARDVVVTVATADGSAQASSDYTMVSTTLTFAAGDTNRTVMVPIMDNPTLEEDETFNITVTSASPDVIAVRNTVTVTIVDDEMVDVSVPSNLAVREDAGFVLVCADITGPMLDKNVVVTLFTADGSALAGEDYGNVSMDLTFMPGGDRSVCLNVSLINDDILEMNKTFRVELYTSDPDVTTAVTTAQVTIISEDTVTVEFSSATVSIEEGNSSMVCVVLTVGRLGRSIVVTLDHTSDEATGIPPALTFMAGDVQQCFTASVAANNVLENDRTFTISLNTTDSEVVVGPQNQVMATIVDTTVVEIGLGMEQYSVTEGMTLMVCVSLRSGMLAREATVLLTFMSGTAMSRSDFTVEMDSVELVFNDSMAQCVEVSTADNSIFEENKTFSVSVTTEDPQVTPNISSAQVTIVENDMLVIGLTRMEYSVVEKETLEVQVNVSDGILGTEIVVTLETMGGNATEGVDYDGVQVELVFNASAMLISTRIRTNSDNLTNENAEVFNIVLSTNYTSPLFSLQPNRAIATIQDAPFISVSPSNQFVLLGDDAMFMVEASGFELRYQWLFDGLVLDGEMDSVRGAATPTLTIMNVMREDLGSYSCLVSNVITNVTSANATLGLLARPMLESITCDTGVRLGGNVTLQCVGSSLDGVVNVTWSTMLPGVTLPSPTLTEENELTVTSSIFLQSLGNEYSGLYFCTVSNRLGQVQGNTTVAVITVEPVESVLATTGTNATLECRASGHPDLQYSWERVNADGVTLIPVPSTMRRIVGDDTANLTILNVGGVDAMLYGCNVSLFKGVVATEIGNLTTRGAMIVESPVDTTVTVPDTLTLNCTGVNNPDAPNPLIFRWAFNGGFVLPGAPGVTFVETAGENLTVTNQLVISPVAPSNAGSYRCDVTNRVFENITDNEDRDFSDNVIVTVRFIPVVTLIADLSTTSMFRVPNGEMRELTCLAMSTPSPFNVELVDTKLNQTIASGNFATSSPVISHSIKANVTASLERNGTVFSCTAENDVGENMTTITLIVTDVPDMVNHSAIERETVSYFSNRLTWPAPDSNGADIISYTLTWCVYLMQGNSCVPGTVTDRTLQDGAFTVNAVGSVSAVVAFGSSATTLRLVIVATNAIGNSVEPAVGFIFDTLLPEDGLPANVTVPVNTPTGAVVTWSPPLLSLVMPLPGETERVRLGRYQVMVLPSGGVPTMTDVTQASSGDMSAFSVAIDISRPIVNQTVTITAIFETPDFTGQPAVVTFAPPSEVVPLFQPANISIGDDTNPRSRLISWPQPPTVSLQGYTITITNTPRPQDSQRRRRQASGTTMTTQMAGPSATSATITNEPFSNVSVDVDANYMPPGSAALVTIPVVNDVTFQSGPALPSAPRNVRAVPLGFTKFTVTWDPPEFPNGVISNYQVRFLTGSIPTSPFVMSPSTTFESPSLSFNTNYTVEVRAINSAGTGPYSSPPFQAKTDFGVEPPVVTNVGAGEGTASLLITIGTRYGTVAFYTIVVSTDVITDSDAAGLDTTQTSDSFYVAFQGDLPQGGGPLRTVLGDENSGTHRNVRFTNTELRGGTDYYVFVKAFSSIDPSVSNTSAVILVNYPAPLNTVAIIVPIACIAVLLLVILFVLLLFAYFTIQSPRRRGYTPKDGLIEKRKNKSGAPMELRRTRLFSPVLNVGSPDVFTSADQPTTLICEASGTPAPDVTWTHRDVPLDKERFIQLADGSLLINNTDIQDEGVYVVRATNAAGEAEASVRVTVLRPSAPESDPDHAPIKVGEFSQKIALVRAEDDEGLEDEYAEVELDWTFTTYTAKLNINKNKNRYINIIPYDHSRVVLSLQDNTPGSDYINASFIDAYQRPNGYIASQGPIPSTFPDFWRMIWELDTPTIVMVTNLKEEDKVKCHQYWPSYGTTTYGNIQVTLKEVENLAEYSIRTFNVSPLAGQSRVPMPVREVRQFHFLVWPDHGVPQYATNLLSFRKRVLKYHPEKRGPMVVHCSAGVGRTGTFITIDYMLKQMEAEGTIDIFNFVRHMRYRRNYMVQTSPQYVFIHDALLEAIMCGDNSIKAPEMRGRVKEMQQMVPETGKTIFETQFNTLMTASPPDDDFDCSIAQVPDNMSKNRSKTHLPANDYRVTLSTDGNQSDYICASYVDNYRERNAFIVTQAPMTETVSDFWRMMWETKSAAIVMLTELTENDQEMCVKYWPSGVGDPSVYGGYQVELSEEEKDRGSYITRRFKLCLLDKPQDSRIVSQFHFTKWSKTTPPTDCRPMIDLIDELQRVQRKSGNMPITVHCDDGVSRTGAFCALYSVLERVKTEQIVDVFQAVKTLRIQRAGLLGTIEEYEFVHRAVIEFLDTFSDYQNFK